MEESLSIGIEMLAMPLAQHAGKPRNAPQGRAEIVRDRKRKGFEFVARRRELRGAIGQGMFEFGDAHQESSIATSPLTAFCWKISRNVISRLNMRSRLRWVREVRGVGKGCRHEANGR